MTTLEKIRAEIVDTAKKTMNDTRAEGLYRALKIIDKYAEQEPTEPLYRLITDNDNLMLLEDYKTGVRTVIEKRLEMISPCDLCRFNPPSSADGKPCTMCPAERRAE